MSIKIRDLITLDSAKNFTLIAGKTGLNNKVNVVDILDFAWKKEQEFSLRQDKNRVIFDADSFVISSLQFAENDPTLLYNTIARLIDSGVSGLAYKPAFYRNLPEEVCRLADKYHFAIFRIDDITSYRDMIVDFSEAINLHRNILELRGFLSKMMYEELSEIEVSNYTNKISPHFYNYARVTIVMPKSNQSKLSSDTIIRKFSKYDEFKRKVVLCEVRIGCNVGIAFICTADADKESTFELISNHALDVCGIEASEYILSISDVHQTFSALNQCVKEAYQAYAACRVMDVSMMQYSNIGTLKFLIPMANTAYMQSFMTSYLAPIMQNEESLRTASVFIRANGDYALAAQALWLHKNTLRYRMNKIRELLSPTETDAVFYEQLSTAIKLYLLTEYLRLNTKSANEY